MNIARFRSKRVILSTAASVAVLGVGGVVWSSTASADLQGDERDRVVDAAVAAVGGGTAVDVESSDDLDLGEAYEVEVRQDDGTEVEVSLDKELKVLGQGADDDSDDDSDDATDDDSDDDSDDREDADDVALSADQRASAEKAALNAVDGGTVTDVEADDDGDEAYEVDVRDADNAEWDVELDADFNVLRKTRDE
ncbi:MAG TPA: PepSY domain-containing protein [Marmoricola sp.]|nr:PepSY domain-containing protein [Marmoricola sp.]